MSHILIDILLHAVVFALVIYRQRHPTSKISVLLWGKIGPRTDVKAMSTEELYGASRYFITAGGYFFGIALATFWLLDIGNPAKPDYEGIKIFLYILPVFFFMMGSIGGLYLFALALLRKQ